MNAGRGTVRKNLRLVPAGPDLNVAARRWRPLAVLSAVALLAFLIAGCSTGPTEEAAGVDDVDSFLSEVTVSGRVDEVFAGGSFTIDADDVSFGDGDSTLVLAPDASEVEEGGYVRARGDVSRLVLDDADAKTVSLHGVELLRDFDGEYVIAASRVEAIEQPGREAAMLEKALSSSARTVPRSTPATSSR